MKKPITGEEYPEHLKLKTVESQSQSIGEFMDWLSSQGMALCRLHSHSEDCYEHDASGGRSHNYPSCGLTNEMYEPANFNTESLLALYFGIDRKKLESEKKLMLETIRRTNRQG